MTKKIYLDYAATTPVDPLVLKAMQPYFKARFGNPGSLHSFGQEAIAAIDEAREKIAEAIGAEFREIIFTSNATEANNLALRGAVKEFRIKNLEYSRRINSLNPKSHILNPRVVVSAIEHESILKTCRDLEGEGVEVIYLAVNKDGVVDLKKLEKELDERTILVSVMSANNEIGTTQPLFEIAKILRDFKKRKSEILISKSETILKSKIQNLKRANQFVDYPLFHVDHSQGFQYLDIKLKEFGIDLMTLSSHKIYGPKGAGALYARNQRPTTDPEAEQARYGAGDQRLISPILTGGGQEFGMRSGTENVSGIVGFAKAVAIAEKLRNKEVKRLIKLRNYLWREIKKIYPKAEMNGLDIGKKLDRNLSFGRKSIEINRLPNNLNVYFPGQSAQDLLIKLDMAGVAVSAGSACSARSTKLSHVLEACGFGKERIKSSLRITLGRPTTREQIDEAVRRLSRIPRN